MYVVVPIHVCIHTLSDFWDIFFEQQKEKMMVLLFSEKFPSKLNKKFETIDFFQKNKSKREKEKKLRPAVALNKTKFWHKTQTCS